MLRRIPTLAVIVVGLCCAVARGEEVKVKVLGEVLAGPAADADHVAWYAAMQKWRTERRDAIHYDAAQYARPEFAWAQRSFVQPQTMVEERYFYDPVAGRYTVDRFLDDLKQRYGGIDSVLLWHVYPNIGVDNRSQRDLLHDLPGGLAGVRQMVEDFHKRGVRVLFPVMPWDTGTHRPGVPLWTAAAQDMKTVGADGINGDTMSGIGPEFRKASDDLGHPLVLEPENQLQNDALVAINNMTWGYWQYQRIPVVSKYKWIEPRHMVNVCERWAKDRTDGLQSAFFNGVGYESWENVWGIWNQLTPRDAEALRRIATIERAMAPLLSNADWEPHCRTLQGAAGVYASRFPGEGHLFLDVEAEYVPGQSADHVRRFPAKGYDLWLLVNRGDKDTSGRQLAVGDKPTGPGVVRYFDLWHGAELRPEKVSGGDSLALSFEIEKRGYGAILAVGADKMPKSAEPLHREIAGGSKTRLSDLSAQWKPLPQKIVEIPRTKPAKEPPEGMVSVPAGKFRFKVSGVEIEGGDGPGVDVQYPWEEISRRHHDKELDLAAFYIDKFPVTNAQFKRFLDASAYRPKDDHNFLKDWKDGTYPAGWDRRPVTWVSIEDARAYAAWSGKRLPHEWEWQAAAQGTDGRLYPWGTAPDPAALPKPDNGQELRGPTDVDAFPKGASPLGVMDLVGNVWQWTDEYVDEHTRAAVLRGGSYYRPTGSMWYFPQNTRLDQHAKYLLMAPCKDRAGTVGFRCVVDGPGGAG